MEQRPSQSIMSVCVHTSGPREWHEYLIASSSQSHQALAGCLCLHLNVAHKVFCVHLKVFCVHLEGIPKDNLTCLQGCHLLPGKHSA